MPAIDKNRGRHSKAAPILVLTLILRISDEFLVAVLGSLVELLLDPIKSFSKTQTELLTKQFFMKARITNTPEEN